MRLIIRFQKDKGIISIFFITCLVFLTRLISFREYSLDPDELEWLYDIRKCIDDPRPFAGFNAHTTGPFAIYLLAGLKLLTGFSKLYQLRILNFLVLVVPSIYLIFHTSQKNAKFIGISAFATFLSGTNGSQVHTWLDGILSYNTEYQILFYSSILFWILRTQQNNLFQFLYFFILFLLPFVKFQAIPITLFFGGFLSLRLLLEKKWGLLTYLLTFYVLLNGLWLIYLHFNGLFENFIENYLYNNLKYLQNKNIGKQEINTWDFIKKINSDYSNLKIIIVLAVISGISQWKFIQPFKIRLFLKHPFTESIGLLIASGLTIIASKNNFEHYYVYLFLPASIFIGDVYVKTVADTQFESKKKIFISFFLVIIFLNFNFSILFKSVRLIWGKFNSKNTEILYIGVPLQKFSNNDLTSYLKNNHINNSSILILGWFNTQTMYYLLQDEYRPNNRSSHAFYLKSFFKDKNWFYFNKEQNNYLEDLRKDPPLFIIDTWDLIEDLKGQRLTNYILANYDYQISFAENKVYKRKSLIK